MNTSEPVFKPQSKLALSLIPFAEYLSRGIFLSALAYLILKTNDICSADALPETRLWLLAGLICIFALGILISGGLYHRLSQRFNPTQTLCLGVALNAIGTAISVIALLSHGSWVLLFASRFISGCGSGNMSVIWSQVGNCHGDQRAHLTRNVQMALGLGFTFGPLFGAYIAATHTYVESLTVFCVLQLALLPYLMRLTFPESIAADASEQAQANWVSKRFLNVILAWFLIMLGWLLFREFLPTILVDSYHIKPQLLGWAYVCIGVTYTLVSFFWLKKLSSRYSGKSLLLVFLPLLAICIFGLYFTNNKVLLCVILVLYTVTSAISVPTLINHMLNETPAHQRKKTASLITASQALITIIATLLFAWHFVEEVRLTLIFSSAVIFVGAVLIQCFKKAR